MRSNVGPADKSNGREERCVYGKYFRSHFRISSNDPSLSQFWIATMAGISSALVPSYPFLWIAFNICCGEGYCHNSPFAFIGMEDVSRTVGRDTVGSGSFGSSGMLFRG